LGIPLNAIDEALILVSTEEFMQVIHLNSDLILLLVDHSLKHSHVLEVTMDRIKLVSWNRWITKRRNEI